MASDPIGVRGSDPATPANDSVTVSMSVPLPPLPAPVASNSRPPSGVGTRANKLHPDATNWNAAEEVPDLPVGPALDEPLDRVATFAPGQDHLVPVGDNIEAAMNDLAEGMDLTVSTKVSDDDGPADKQILIRATENDRERWKRAAEKAEVSLSALIRDTMNLKVTDILDCSHPMEFRQEYPWASFCTKCDVRLRG